MLLFLTAINTVILATIGGFMGYQSYITNKELRESLKRSNDFINKYIKGER